MLSGAGLFATVIGIRSEVEGFPTLAIGLVTAAYYLGFLIGSRVALAALGSVGHIRVYAALASILAASILFAGMVVTPWAWVTVRLVAGACLAGQYVVAESWLNQLVTNANRGRILSLYSLVTIVAYGLGQLSIGVIDPTTLTAFGIAAIVISLAVSPVALSEEAAPPIIATPDRMTLRELFSIVPTGVITSVLVGVAHGSFLGLAAVYATRGGLSEGEIGVFVALPTIGSLLLHASDLGRLRRHRPAGGRGAGRIHRRRRGGSCSSPTSGVGEHGGDGADRRHHVPALLDRRRLHQRLGADREAHRRRIAAGGVVRRRCVRRPVPGIGRDGRGRQQRVRLDRRRRPPRDRLVPGRTGSCNGGRRSARSRGTRSRSPVGCSTCRPPRSAWVVGSARPGTGGCRCPGQMR